MAELLDDPAGYFKDQWSRFSPDDVRNFLGDTVRPDALTTRQRAILTLPVAIRGAYYNLTHNLGRLGAFFTARGLLNWPTKILGVVATAVLGGKDIYNGYQHGDVKGATNAAIDVGISVGGAM